LVSLVSFEMRRDEKGRLQAVAAELGGIKSFRQNSAGAFSSVIVGLALLLMLVMWAMLVSLARTAQSLQAHTRSFLLGMHLSHNQSFNASQRRTRVQRWHLVPTLCFTKSSAMFLAWTVIAMEFRASSNCATELQTAMLVLIVIFPGASFVFTSPCQDSQSLFSSVSCQAEHNG
jgi:hypothetical protein